MLTLYRAASVGLLFSGGGCQLSQQGSASRLRQTVGSAPGWARLVQQLDEDLTGAASNDPVDVISASAELYGRPQLVERLMDVLLVKEIEPGPVHIAFAQLPLDIVVTTNVDFLLERVYEQQRRPCEPLLGESQLSIGRGGDATHLLKFSMAICVTRTRLWSPRTITTGSFDAIPY
jgi:hypothetical protein